MSDDRRWRINTIRQLFALAEHPDTPPEEKESAFARAGWLMFKYEIEEAEVKRLEGDGNDRIVLYDHAVSGRGGHGRERAWALGAVAEGMGCATAYQGNDAGRRLRWVRIVGPEPTIENLKVLLPAVLSQMEGAAVKAARAHARNLPGWLTGSERAAETATVRRSFMRGFGQGIKDKLEKSRKAYAANLREQASSGHVVSSSRELVVLDRSQRVAAEFKRQFPKLGKARKPKRFAPSAYRDGRDAGTRADLGDRDVRDRDRPELE